MNAPIYLVTGGAGFIGSNFIRFLLNQYSDIHIINLDNLMYAGNLGNLSDIEHDPRYSFVKADLCDSANLKNTFDRFNPEYMINFTAESHVDRSIIQLSIFILSNVSGVQKLLDVSLKFGVKKYLQISTDEIYGSLEGEGSNIEFVKLIIQMFADLHPDLKVSEDLVAYVKDRKGHDRRYAIDSTKIQKDLKWKSSIPFEHGLKKTIRWYLDRSDWLDLLITKEYLAYYQKVYGNKFPA
jgi:dTDP-D-glucose 4,6-dehydratase